MSAKLISLSILPQNTGWQIHSICQSFFFFPQHCWHNLTCSSFHCTWGETFLRDGWRIAIVNECSPCLNQHISKPNVFFFPTLPLKIVSKSAFSHTPHIFVNLPNTWYFLFFGRLETQTECPITNSVHNFPVTKHSLQVADTISIPSLPIYFFHHIKFKFLEQRSLLGCPSSN